MAGIRNVGKQSVKKAFSARKSKAWTCVAFVGFKNTLFAVKTV